MPVARNVKYQVDPLRAGDARVYFVPHPVFRNPSLYAHHIGGEARPEIPARARDPESALSPGRTEGSIRTAHRAAFPERYLVVFRLWRGMGVRLRLGDLLLFRFDLFVLAGNVDGVRLFFLDLGLGLRDAF